MEHWSEYLRVLTAMFVIVNPLGAIPMYAGLTAGHPEGVRRRTARVAALTAGAILCGAALAGEWMLLFFGIDVYCFQVGGGILLLMIAVAMFQAKSSRTKTTPEETHEAESRETVGVVPLGTPLLVGPGAISTAIIYAHKSESPLDTAVLLAACLVIAACVWLVLRAGRPHLARPGQDRHEHPQPPHGPDPRRRGREVHRRRRGATLARLGAVVGGVKLRPTKQAVGYASA